MLSSTTRTAADADELQTALRPNNGVVTVTAAGAFKADVVLIDLSRLWMQSAQETATRGWRLGMPRERSGVMFLTNTDAPLIVQGQEMDANSIAWLPAGETIWHRLSGPTRWGSISLPLENWSELVGTIAGLDVVPRAGEFRVTPSHRALTTLRRRHLAAVHLAERAPELVANPEVARGLEQSLIEALVECLRAQPAHLGTIARQHHHARIMARFWQAVEKHVDEAIYLPELCAEIGVADRTLRQCCEEYLGVSPKRYLLLRRLHLARTALRSKAATSVTEVATSLGFWELGRFAVTYRGLFGETPSQTLRRGARRSAE